MWRVTYPARPDITEREIVEDHEGLVEYYVGVYAPHKNYVRTGTGYETSWLIPSDLTEPVCDSCKCSLIGRQIVDRNCLSANTLAVPSRWQLCDECLIWDLTDQHERVTFAEGCLGEYWKPRKQINPWTHQTKPGYNFLMAFGKKAGQFLYLYSAKIEPVK